MDIIRIGALEIRFLHDKDSTHGGLDMFEMLVPPNGQVPIPHHHESWDETVYRLEGQMTWTIAGKEVVTGPGASAFIPRGIVHHFNNSSGHPARVLSVLTPGVLGPAYFHEIAALLADGQPPDPARMGAVMRRHGLVPA